MGTPAEPPPILIQFADFAVWQQRRQAHWMLRHGRYWQQRLSGVQLLRFPHGTSSDETGWGFVRIHINPEFRSRLSEWARIRRTTIVTTLLTAYAAILLRWCEASDGVIRYQTNGRVDPKLENTIGFLAASLHLRVELLERDTFIDLLSRVTQEYCNAYEHHDCSYLDVQQPLPEYCGSSLFNWVSAEPRNVTAQEGGKTAGARLRWSPEPFINPVLERLDVQCEPSILLYEGDTGIAMDLVYPRNRFRAESMQRFAANLNVFIDSMLNRPQMQISSIRLS